MGKIKVIKESKEKIFQQDKTSKEIKGIQNAIDKYVKKHDGNVMFHGSFMAFEGKECDIIDDILFCFGPKEGVLMDLKEMAKEIKKEKGKFINW